MVILLSLFINACELPPAPTPTPIQIAHPTLDQQNKNTRTPGDTSTSPSSSRVENGSAEKKSFTVCTRDDSPPFGYRSPDDGLIGFDIDLIKELGHRWLEISKDQEILTEELTLVDGFAGKDEEGKQEAIEKLLNDKNKIERQWEDDNRKGIIFIIVPANQRIPCLEGGWGDLLVAAFSYTKKRCEENNNINCIKKYYFQDILGLLVRKDSGIEGICNINGQTLLILDGTLPEEKVENGEIQFCPDTNPHIDIRDTKREVLIEEVIENREVYKAYITDMIILESIAKQTEYKEDLKVVKAGFASSDYIMATPRTARKGLENFDKFVTDTLVEMVQEHVYQDLHKKYFHCVPPPYSGLIPNQYNPCEQNITLYTIQPGDILGEIAYRFYGDFYKYECLRNANDNIISDSNVIYPDQKIFIPPTCPEAN